MQPFALSLKTCYMAPEVIKLISCLTQPSMKFQLLIDVEIFKIQVQNSKTNKRTNGPVNAHLRSAVYTNDIENSPSIGADEALGPFFFIRIINILSIQVFPFK